MTAARQLSISGVVRAAVAKRRGGRAWQAHLLPQRLGQGVEVNDLRALDEGGGEQLLFRQWQMSEPGTGLVSWDSKVLGVLCEEPKDKHLSGLLWGFWKDGWIPALWSVWQPLALWLGFPSLAAWQALGAGSLPFST